MTTKAILFVLSLVTFCHGYGRFRSLIPNGYQVPNPCTADTTDFWSRVGHVIQSKPDDVNKEKNQFGEDFRIARNNLLSEGLDESLVWERICNMDSDGDGEKNGAELGDPSCAWRSGAPTQLDTQNLTHPGIPENLNGQVIEEARMKYCYI